jgi:hypothetical protein
LATYELGGSVCRVDYAIENHSPDTIGKEFGVYGAESCSVREAHEVEIVFAQRRTQHVKISCAVISAHMREEMWGISDAGLGDLSTEVDVGRHLSMCVGRRVGSDKGIG